MQSGQQIKTAGSTGFRFLDFVERVGNKLPNPVTLFAIGALLVLLGSELAFQLGWEENDPKYQPPAVVEGEAAVADAEVPKIRAISLLRRDGAQWAWKNMVVNFTSFAPLGVVLVAMIGIGVAERSGLIGTILKSMINFTPRALITPALVFVGVMSSMTADAGYVVLPPLAAIILIRLGRSPLVGIAACFAGVSAGFSANLFITSLDPLLQELTQKGVALVDDEYVVDPRCNYYLMICSTFLITGVGWAVTRFFVEPRFNQQQIQDQIAAGQASDAGDEPTEQANAADSSSSEQASEALTDAEKKGLIWAAVGFVVTALFFVLLVFIKDFPLHGKVPGGETPVWVGAIVPMIFVLFFIPGILYGVATGVIRRDNDIAEMMSKTMSTMGSYIVMAFFAAQFIAWFGYSQVGTLIAISGADFLQQFELPFWLLVLAFIFLSGFLNLFIGSASAKWALIAPVFVPLFMRLGVSPELTQGAYRIGDSITNIIAPLNPYVIIILVFIRKYVPNAGLGTLVSLMLPYTVAFSLMWSLMLVIWMFIGAPLGPDGAELFLEK